MVNWKKFTELINFDCAQNLNPHHVEDAEGHRDARYQRLVAEDDAVVELASTTSRRTAAVGRYLHVVAAGAEKLHPRPLTHPTLSSKATVTRHIT